MKAYNIKRLCRRTLPFDPQEYIEVVFDNEHDAEQFCDKFKIPKEFGWSDVGGLCVSLNIGQFPHGLDLMLVDESYRYDIDQLTVENADLRRGSTLDPAMVDRLAGENEALRSNRGQDHDELKRLRKVIVDAAQWVRRFQTVPYNPLLAPLLTVADELERENPSGRDP